LVLRGRERGGENIDEGKTSALVGMGEMAKECDGRGERGKREKGCLSWRRGERGGIQSVRSVSRGEQYLDIDGSVDGHDLVDEDGGEEGQPTSDAGKAMLPHSHHADMY
jgi:hypothetical protein